MKKILIIDDDQDICLMLTRYLNRKGYEADSAGSAKAGLEKLKQTPQDLVISDFKMPGMDGLELIPNLKKIQPDVKIILITGYSDVRVAVKALKLGALDYVTKPLYPDEILHTIENALSKKADSQKTARSQKQKKLQSYTFIEGTSQHAQLIKKHIELIAPTDMTTVILGETGTGKEYTAREIHAKSNRNNQPFEAVDCGALPKGLAGSELFGHVKGAFTGALNNKKGCFERANKGTLFLDEIGNLSYDNQVKLLRVLQEREVQPIGAEKKVAVDVRLIIATNESLQDAVQKGDFREDLYHRINEFKIELLPLRKRADDIETYVAHFLEEANASLGKNIHGVSPEALNKIKAYPWPGNLRELRNVIKRFVLLTNDAEIKTDVFPLEILDPNLQADEPDSGINEKQLTLKMVAQHAEKKAIIRALQSTSNNKSKAATLLDIDRKTLYNKLNEYNINL